MAAATALLIAISLRWGPTPLVPSLALAGGWVGLAGALAFGAVRRSRMAWAGSAAGFVLLAVGTVLASQAAAHTPPIVGPDGRPLAGSIAALERVPVNGTEQWVSIRGRSAESPVLLWLAGGPGGSQLATGRYHLAPLEERFVVVNWEQPGAGKSYHAVRHAALTPERYVADGIALAQYLRERFGEQKIYVAGESWGSVLGIWIVQRRPDLFHAFAGTGQMVAFLETDLASFDFSLRLARERGDEAKVAQLEALGRPPYYGPGVAMMQVTYLMDGFNYMNADPNIAQDGFDTIQDLLSPEYGLYDKVNWLRGALDSLDTVYPQLWDVDLRDTAPRLEVPTYFLVGRHDVNASPALAEDYFRRLESPRKAWVWFERSGHNPWVSEAERFCAVLSELLLGA
jgi:pimeloyl-ACP methyl ester carboxylesterase